MVVLPIDFILRFSVPVIDGLLEQLCARKEKTINTAKFLSFISFMVRRPSMSIKDILVYVDKWPAEGLARP